MTMSEKRLQTRVKVIERAQGMYAVHKMRMFVEVLILEGYEEIAEMAKEALERLVLVPRFATSTSKLSLGTVKGGKKGGGKAGEKVGKKVGKEAGNEEAELNAALKAAAEDEEVGGKAAADA